MLRILPAGPGMLVGGASAADSVLRMLPVRPGTLVGGASAADSVLRMLPVSPGTLVGGASAADWMPADPGRTAGVAEAAALAVTVVVGVPPETMLRVGVASAVWEEPTCTVPP